MARTRFGLAPFRSPLLRPVLTSSGYVRCFSSPAYPHTDYVFIGGSQGSPPCGVPPFGHPRLPARARLPEAFRCYATSFFGTNDLGIHPTPFVTVPQKPPIDNTQASPPSPCTRDPRSTFPQTSCSQSTTRPVSAPPLLLRPRSSPVNAPLRKRHCAAGTKDTTRRKPCQGVCAATVKHRRASRHSDARGGFSRHVSNRQITRMEKHSLGWLRKMLDISHH